MTVGTMLGLAVVALVMCALQYHRERVATLQVLDSAATERVMALDAVLAASVRPVTAMRRAAESLVESETLETIARLQPMLFNLAPNLMTLGFRTSEGVIASFPPNRAQEENEGDWSAAQSAANPERRPVWSEVSQDKASHTLMVRYAEPAFRAERPVGVAAADISLEFLRQVIEMPDYSGQRLVLVDRSRHVLADSRLGASQGKDAMLALGEILPVSLVPDSVFAADPNRAPVQIPTHGYTVLVAPLTAAPWVLVCLVPEGALFLRVLPWFTIALVLIAAVFVVITAGRIYVSQRFVKPALNLVRLVGAEASGDVLPPQRVPVAWRPLFARVAGAFAASRAQLARATGEATQANRVTEDHLQERARIEAALAHEIALRGLTEAVLDGAPALVLVLDREGRIVRFNRRCEAVSGILATAARGRRPWEFLVPPEDAELARVQIDSALRGDGPIVAVNHWLAPGDAPRRISWSMAALTDADREVTHVVAMGLEC